ncbi:MAG TPA: hypothetical protein VHG51_03465 [Longimicrobiaceae bacterium]|nr:hypothetical protein [Longimicrobiaceae bacterium]
MFRERSGDEHERGSEGGKRHLFALAGFELHDALDAEGRMRHFVLEPEGDRVYEADRATMYELMARFLAGEYEKVEYGLERSPAHEALLDLLEIATARARSGDGDFTLDELEGVGLDGDDGEDDGRG